MDYGYIRTFNSIKEASIDSGVERRLIGSVCSGITFSAGGFRWKYEDDPEDFAYPKGGAIRPVEQIDLEIDEVVAVFNSIKEASASTGASLTHIGSVCRGKRKQCGGYGWKFVAKPEVIKEIPIYDKWKAVENAPNYRVSKKGEVWSISAKKKMKLTPFKDGYCYIKVNGANLSIHRLVATLYIPNPDDLPVVNHKDGNKSNNNVENLEWVTRSRNAKHAIETGLVKSREKKVRQLDKEGNLIKIHKSAKDAAVEMGVTKGAIYAACQGRVKLCRGYKFET